MSTTVVVRYFKWKKSPTVPQNIAEIQKGDKNN